MEIIETRRVDDIDNSLAADQQVRFSVGNKHYVIDLTDEHKRKFDEAMEYWVKHARSVPASGKRRRTTRASDSEVRAWLKANGHDVPDRGRISSAYIDLYDANH